MCANNPVICPLTKLFWVKFCQNLAGVQLIGFNFSLFCISSKDQCWPTCWDSAILFSYIIFLEYLFFFMALLVKKNNCLSIEGTLVSYTEMYDCNTENQTIYSLCWKSVQSSKPVPSCESWTLVFLFGLAVQKLQLLNCGLKSGLCLEFYNNFCLWNTVVALYWNEKLVLDVNAITHHT